MFNVMRIDRKEEGNIHTLKYNHLQFNIRYIIRTLVLLISVNSMG